MSEKSEALRLADALGAAIKQVDADDDVIHVARWFVEDADAELRRQHAEIESLRREQEEDQCAIRVWRRRADQAEAKSDALFEVLKSALRHAEWRDKIIYPSGGEEFQNWMISIYLPVPLSASDKSPETALDRFVADAIKAVEEGK